MLQLLRLLLYLAAAAVFYASGTQSIYYESAPSCGYPVTGFIQFGQSPELSKEPYLGVCGVGIDGISQLQGRIKSCVSCTFTPKDKPTCDNGATEVPEPVWNLALQQDCEWQGCTGNSCNGTVESTTKCIDGTVHFKCCPNKRYIRCCKLVECISRNSPAGQCVDGEKDLLPGQQYVSRMFAVSAVSTDCYQYSFEVTRICRADRTFAPVAYESCTRKTVSRDSEGCVKLPGYTFYRGVRVKDSKNWRIDDGTPWGKLEKATQQAAAADMLLMASRCSALDSCAGFQNTGDTTDLLYQLPTTDNWTVEVDEPASARCHGIYEKSPPLTSCPRLSGYLFIPQRTVDISVTADFMPSASPCSNCSNSSALAGMCTRSSSCAGFSNFQGLLTRSNASRTSLLSDAFMTQFTITPCVGMFVRTDGVFPQEVEQLDRLLCGERVYCSSSQLRYHASSQSSAAGIYVDLTLDIYSDLTVPRGLQDAAGGGLQQLPTLRSLNFRCHNGSTLLGGLPVGLASLAPFLQELRVQGCRTSGPLPAELAQLRYLRVLDVGSNALEGPLPATWGSMTLKYLNLSNNALTGTLPVQWRSIITWQGAAPPPPPLGSTGVQSQSDMVVADLSANRLDGPVDRGFVYESCVHKKLRIVLRGDPTRVLASNSDMAILLLHYNPGIANWSWQYTVADLASHSGSSNLCGAYGYKIALGVLWGVFGVCFLAIASWSAYLAWKASRAMRRGRFFISDMDGPAAAEHTPTLRGCSQLWRKRWVRRVTLLARIGYLAADIALDIRVTVWLFIDGDTSSAAVCLAFLLATQVVISAALVVSLSHHFFSSRLLAALLSPLLLALGPVAGPVLALANVRNSDVPLVFWRYLELVEFSVALLQAPAESVTQSVVYARLNKLGNGMYLDHGLFVASIILSLGDMLIAAVKLCRYKRGPLRRILVALTHLDRVRNPVDYEKPFLSEYVDDGTGTGDYVSRYLDTPLNPPTDADGRQSPTATRMDAGPLPISPPGGEAGEGGATLVLELSPREQLPSGEEGRAAVAAAVATTAHTFTPLTAPRYRPSLLAASSQRLGGGAHAVGAPSRLGPRGAARSGALAVSTQPPLRSSHAHLPVTQTASEGMVGGASGTSSSAQSAAVEVETGVSEQGKPAAGNGSHFIASDVYASAATGGHGAPLMTGVGPAPDAQDKIQLVSNDSPAASSSVVAAAVVAAAIPPPSPSVDPRYLPSAAVAVKAALADSGALTGLPPPQVSSVQHGPAVASLSGTPERLVLVSPLGPSSVSASGQVQDGVGPTLNARALRHLSSQAPSSRSAQESPARRREGLALSIAVPASPVHAQGIEVIRMTTPSSARHLSPLSSCGAPTPVGMLPPPPQQHLQMQRRQERLEMHQQQQEQEQQQEQQHQQQAIGDQE